MHWNTLLAAGFVVCSVSCSSRTTGGESPSSLPTISARELTPPTPATTNYAIRVVQPAGGTNFAIRTVASDPTKHYAMRYVPK